MKQLKEDVLCYYCLSCSKLKNEAFDGVRNCVNFTPDRENWREKLIEAMKGAKDE